MGQLGDALRSAGQQLEARLHAREQTLKHDPIGSVLPQSWRFVTESETAVLRIDASGRVTVLDDVTEAPDVIVTWTQANLVAALLSGRSSEHARSSPPQVRFPTPQGRTAFSSVGTSLGL